MSVRLTALCLEMEPLYSAWVSPCWNAGSSRRGGAVGEIWGVCVCVWGWQLTSRCVQAPSYGSLFCIKALCFSFFTPLLLFVAPPPSPPLFSFIRLLIIPTICWLCMPVWLKYSPRNDKKRHFFWFLNTAQLSFSLSLCGFSWIQRNVNDSGLRSVLCVLIRL